MPDWNVLVSGAAMAQSTCAVKAANSIAPFDGWTSAQMEQDSTSQLNGIRVDF